MKVPPRSKGLREERASSLGKSQKLLLPAQQYIHDETVSGILLVAAAGVALIWANSPWRDAYQQLFHVPITLGIGQFILSDDLTHWINDGLMAVFFFVVALEIKRELLHGELSSLRKAALPFAAALGGMLVPVGIYLAFNATGENWRGFGVPMATDIAFAVGVLALLSRRIPSQLRIFLLTYAIVDDIGSILVIAVFYTQEFSLAASGIAAGSLGVILVMRWIGFRTPLMYLLPALVFWAATWKSGVHATIAGVILGFVTPARSQNDPRALFERFEDDLPEMRNALNEDRHEHVEMMLGRAEEIIRGSESPLERLERTVHPWVSFLILPLFALANAGVEVSAEMLRKAASNPVTLGIFAGLLFGKVIGTTGGAWIAAKAGFAQLPEKLNWHHLTGAGLLGGIGFTVSLFITNLAFQGGETASLAKIGILVASFSAAIAGCLYLLFATRNKRGSAGKDDEPA